MKTLGHCPSSIGLEKHGVVDAGDVYWNLAPAELCEHALRAGEGTLASCGALCCTTGTHTGRSPNDKFIVKDDETVRHVDFGSVNRGLSTAQFDGLHRRVIDHFKTRRLYVRDLFAGADPASSVPIRVVSEYAWHSLFANALFVRSAWGSTADHDPRFTILCAPSCKADPSTDGVSSETFIALDLSRGLVVIGGTQYAGEIKKSIFSIMNYILPLSGVLTMHCSANIGSDRDVALFFGLSGTGKTTLSADPDRRLIGDDEHAWNDNGVYNIEGGCYAKCIRLSEQTEPQIYKAIRFGSVLENVVIDPVTREPDFDSDQFTENTRAAYPIHFIDNAVQPSVGGHPKNIVLLTCDAFGVLPPISRLTAEQAMYHFLSGYTAKVAGTERGISEPQATFSACFAAPFLPLPPQTYAKMLGERIAKHNVACWLVNTGWSGGAYGQGRRLKLSYTRSMVRAALAGSLNEDVAYEAHPVFGVSVPQSCPDVPTEVLNPKSTWSDGAAYDAKARALAGLFVENFQNFPHVSPAIAAAGPQST